MKKKIVSVNLGNLGSTGGIMHGISVTAREAGFESVEAYPKRFDNIPVREGDILIVSDFMRRVYEKLACYTGFNGCFSVIPTLRFLKKLGKIKPDILHFHNLHNSFINLPLLFRYIKKKDVSVVWTLHDCWPFTGQCPHFTMSGCDKWISGCHDCKVTIEYPKSAFDNTKTMYALKKKWFTGVNDLTIVTPSQWLADLASESYLKEYRILVINNGIDLSVFRPTDGDFRIKNGLGGKFVILGVAFNWGKSKGLDVFIELAEKLDDSCRIVLVGTNDDIDRQLPPNIISVHRTQSKQELAEIYTAADVFVNPTREENYPTVNMEALACGTPVITFRTGGSPEIIDEKTGTAVERGDISGLMREIERYRTECPQKEECLLRAEDFDEKEKFAEYVDLYRDIIDRRS